MRCSIHSLVLVEALTDDVCWDCEAVDGVDHQCAECGRTFCETCVREERQDDALQKTV